MRSTQLSLTLALMPVLACAPGEASRASLTLDAASAAPNDVQAAGNTAADQGDAAPSFDAGVATLDAALQEGGERASAPASAQDARPGQALADAALAIDAAPVFAGDSAVDANARPPFVADGAPLRGERGSWTFHEVPDARCRDGSPAGISLNLGSVNKLMIFLEGGGRCADEQTCAINSASVDDPLALAVRALASGGIFDRGRSENPVRDWHFVHVPYCTGDRHGGDNPDAQVPGVGPQRLVGYRNMNILLKRIVPTFPDLSDVLLTGISAGGFGAAYNALQVQRAFPKIKVKLVIDSAPFVSRAVFSPCDQRRTRTLGKIEQTFLGDCGAECPRVDDYWLDYGVFLARAFGDRPAGLICPMEDGVERALFGIGNDDCTGALDLFDPGISAVAFRAELLSYRDRIKPFTNFGTFYPEGEMHTLIAFEDFYSVSAGGVRLVDWFARIVNGESPGHAGP